MPFTPLNKQEESEYDIERHIREVELENALKLYQDALKLHYRARWDAAADAYDSLLASDVLQDVLRKGPSAIKETDTGFLSTTQSSVTLLPYLIFKNHGSLLLDRLRAEWTQSSQEVVQNTIHQVIMEYATALSFESGDITLWRRILKLSDLAGLDRVARFALEVELCSDEDNEGQLRALLWDDDADPYRNFASDKLRNLLRRLEDHFTIEKRRRLVPRQYYMADQDLDWLTADIVGPLDDAAARIRPTSVQIIAVRPTSCNWYGLIRAALEKQRVSINRLASVPVHFTIEVPDTNADSVYSAETRSAISSISGLDDGLQELDTVLDKSEEQEHPEEEETPVESSLLPPSPPDSAVDESLHSEMQADDASPGGFQQEKQNAVPDSDSGGESVHSDESDQESHTDPESGRMAVALEESHSTFLSGGVSHAEQGTNLIREVNDNAVSVDGYDDMDFNMQTLDQSPIVSPARSPTTSQKRNADALESDIDREEEADDFNVRASKRVKRRATFLTNTNSGTFQDAMDQVFRQLDIDIDDLLELDPAAPDLDDADVESTDIYVDFKMFLFDDESDSVLQSTAISHKFPETSFSKSMMFNYPDLVMPKKDADCDRSQLTGLAARIEAGGSYLRNVNLEILMTLMSSECPTVVTPYLEHTWSAQLRTAVMRLVVCEESLLEEKLVANLVRFESDYDTNSIVQTLSWAQAILELSLDEMVQNQKLLLENEPVNDPSFTDNRTHRWRSHIFAIFALLPEEVTLPYYIDLRFRWACVIMDQVSGAPVDEIIRSYSCLKQALELRAQFSQLLLPNCQSIHLLSVGAVDLEISKFSTMDFFNEVFENTRIFNFDIVLEHLEPVLLNNNGGSNERPQVDMIEEHLLRSPLEFRLQLWEMLARALSAKKRSSDAVFCHLRAIKLLHSDVKAPRNREPPLFHRQMAILDVIKRSSDLANTALSTIDSQYDVLTNWTPERCRTALGALFESLSLLQVFVYYEDSASEDNLYIRTSVPFVTFRNKAREDVVRVWKLIYYIYRQFLECESHDHESIGQTLSSLISLLHEELGVRGYCSLLDGTMLDVFESELFRLDRAETETDLVQVLHCRYDISYRIGPFVPWDHYAKGIELSSEKACQILPFVLSFTSQRSPGVWLPKSDIREALERLHKSIWADIKETTEVLRNKAVVDRWLQQEISPKDFKGSLCGALVIGARAIGNHEQIPEKQWNALSTLNLTLGRIHLSMYKARNKNNSKGIPDLGEAQSYFTFDLYIYPGRVESWKALAFIASVLAGNELSFDAQRIWDHRADISGLQRESILCYMMATSLAIRERWLMTTPNCSSDISFADLLFEFGLQIYNASRAPLSMESFARDELKFVERGAELPEMECRPEVTLHEAFQNASRCFYRASEKCAEPWLCHLYLGKVHEKLGLNPSIALDNYRKAISLAPTTSAVENGPLLQPHYRMVSSISKYMMADEIDCDLAIHYLKETPFAKDLVEVETWNKADVMSAVQAALLNICHADKKHWHHRPVYRLAMLAYHLPASADTSGESVKAARTRLESLFTAKGSGGNLLSIWRPEHERPGRHYYYAYCYTHLYMTFMLEQEDMESIRNLMRRVRKATTNIMDHRDIWDTLCDQFLTLSLSKNEVPQEDPALFVDVIESSEFNISSSRLELAAARPTFSPPALRALRDFYDLRKLNGGLYDTNRIDDAIITCYLALYVQVRGSSNDELGLPESKSEPVLPASSILTSNGAVPVNATEETGVSRQTVLTPLSCGTTSAVEIVCVQKSEISVTNNTPASVPVPSATVPKKGRTKEPKITRVSRRDILSKSFVLCKPKPAPAEQVSGRARNDSLRASTSRNRQDLERRGSIASSAGTLAAGENTVQGHVVQEATADDDGPVETENTDSPMVNGREGPVMHL